MSVFCLPLFFSVSAATAEYEAAMAIVNEKKAALRAVQEQIADLQANLNAKKEQEQSLSDEKQSVESKLERANKLLQGLGDFFILQPGNPYQLAP